MNPDDTTYFTKIQLNIIPIYIQVSEVVLSFRFSIFHITVTFIKVCSAIYLPKCNAIHP
jgi:hypothetical protein